LTGLSNWKQGNIMALEKVISVDLIEVIENGSVQVRTKTAIMEDGKQISGSFHRHIVVPGADYSAEDAKVQAICSAMHTAGVIAAYQATIASAKV
jgi:archaellum component FlaF (FlaF/FlaG flagellin family)